MTPQPKPPQERPDGTINTLQVRVDGAGQERMILAPTRRMARTADDSIDDRTIPLYRLHGVEDGEDLVGRLQERRSAFTEGAPRFQAGGVIGEGSQGLIMRVHDQDCRRDVALKTLHHASSDLDEISRFIHEAQVTAQLEHPGIVPVHDVGVLSDGTVFYTMKRVAGVNLADYLAERAGKPELRFEMLELYLRACDAVAFAHSRGVIHRDLKPRNIMVGSFGEILVLDWGLAKIVGTPPSAKDRIRSMDLPDSDGDVHRTLEGYAVGTPAYMSPEQARGSHQVIIDQRCDVYSMGVILYEILCGVSPYQRGNVRKTLEQVARGEWKPLDRQETARGIPRRLVAIVHRAMAVEVAQRYQSIQDIIDDLHHFLAGRPVGAYRETPLEIAVRQLHNHGRLIGAVALTVLVAAALAGIWRWREQAAEAAQIAGWYQEADGKQAAGEEAFRKSELESDAPHQAAWRRQAQEALEDARRTCEGILTVRAGDMRASEQLNRICTQLDAIAAVELKVQNRAEARRKADITAERAERWRRDAQAIEDQAAVRAAQTGARSSAAAMSEEEYTACIDGLRQSSEGFRTAQGFAPEDKGLDDRYAKVIDARARLEQGRNFEKIDTAMREQADRKAEELIRQAQAAVRRNGFDDALGCIQGAMAFKYRAQDLEFRDQVVKLQAKANDVKRQQEADGLFQCAEAMISQESIDDKQIDQVVACLSKSEDLWHDAERLAKGQDMVGKARQQLARAEAQALLGRAERTWAGAERDRKELALLQGAMTVQRARALEYGETAAIQELSRLEQSAGPLGEKVAQQLAEVISLLLQAEARAGGYLPVRERLADYYVERLIEAEQDGRAADAAVAKAMAERYDGDQGRHAATIRGEATATCAVGSLPVTLRPIGRQAELGDRAGAVTLALEPGQRASLPHGRYLVEGVAANGAVLAQALEFQRGQSREIMLQAPPVLPPGLVYIPSGQIQLAGGRQAPCPTVPAFAIGRFELACGDWIAFLNDPATLRRYDEERAKGVLRFAPRISFDSPEPLWKQQSVPVWQKHPGEFLLAFRDGDLPVDPRQPVTGISFLDVQDYLAWRRDRDHLDWRLPTMAEWTLAAQGGDGRAFVWGGQFDPHGCASGFDLQRWPKALRGGAVEKDCSVQGVCDLAGSVSEFVSDTVGDGLRTMMGGNFTDRLPDRFRTTSSRACDQRMVFSGCGVRLALSLP